MTGAVAIAVSGGIDSLVSAYLLKQKHKDLFGIHFLTGYEDRSDPMWPRLETLFGRLGIPVAVVDLSDAFQNTVVDYFVRSYQRGQTPNPCLVCNPRIKFGALFTKARELGASHLATGHYAQVVSKPDGRFGLARGVDPMKDQSYFLARLDQEQLSRAVFPLGTWTKAAVKALAAQKGLQPVSRLESQDVCFIHESTYTDFLARIAGIATRPGDIVDTSGRRVGRHDGLYRYTIGQRRGINCPAGQAYYVIRLDVPNNRLVVGFKEEGDAGGCRVSDVNWIAGMPDGPMAVETRIRYRHRAAASMVTPVGRSGATIRFDTPQAAVTPGQGAVFYRGPEVIGGGWIDGSDPSNPLNPPSQPNQLNQ